MATFPFYVTEDTWPKDQLPFMLNENFRRFVASTDNIADDAVTAGKMVGNAQFMFVTRDANQSISDASPTTVQWNNVISDASSNFNAANYGYVCPSNGLYMFISVVRWNTPPDATSHQIRFTVDSGPSSTLTFRCGGTPTGAANLVFSN